MASFHRQRQSPKRAIVLLQNPKRTLHFRHIETSDHRIETVRRATRVGTFDICVCACRITCLLRGFWPVNSPFWPIEPLNGLFRHCLGSQWHKNIRKCCTAWRRNCLLSILCFSTSLYTSRCAPATTESSV